MTLAESICQLIKKREEFGTQKYGRPLCPHTDKRDFLQEAIEEWADQGFYLMAAIEKREASRAKQHARSKRHYDSKAGKEARRKYQQKYRLSPHGKAVHHKYNISPKGKAKSWKANKVFRSKPANRETNKWACRSWRKLQKIRNATL